MRGEDGFVSSHCGLWVIVPLFWGCASPQSYELKRRPTDEGMFSAVGVYQTQREAKEAAERVRVRDSWEPSGCIDCGRSFPGRVDDEDAEDWGWLATDEGMRCPECDLEDHRAFRREGGL